MFEVRVVGFFYCAGIAVWMVGCSAKQEADRPANVTQGAAFVRGAKVGWWQHCRTGSESEKTQCTIWNAGGQVLYEGAFVPYDEGPNPTATDLEIPTDPKYPGPDRVCLRNGRILIPESEFDRLKRFFDWITGKRQAP